MENLLLKSLKEKKDKLLSQVEILDSMIEEEERKLNESNAENQSSKIIVERPLTRKIKFSTFGKTDSGKFLGVLQKYQRFMKVREIANEVADVEGGMIEEWVIKLSRKTRGLQKANKIAKYQYGDSKTNYFWGSPKWIKNGEIKEGFEYDPKSISKKGSSSLDDIEL